MEDERVNRKKLGFRGISPSFLLDVVNINVAYVSVAGLQGGTLKKLCGSWCGCACQRGCDGGSTCLGAGM